MHKVEEVWESHSLHRELNKACGKISFPVFLSSAVETRENWKSLNKIDLRMGGAFINEVDNRHVPAVLELLAALVKCDPSGRNQTDWEKAKSVYAAIPVMFIDLANQCRSH